MSSLAPPAAASTTPTRTTWAFWISYSLFATFLGAYVIYVAVVIGRMSSHNEEPIPRSLNAIALTALSLAATLSFVAAGNRRRSDRDVEWQSVIKSEIAALRADQAAAAEASRAIVAGIARLTDRLGARPDDDPTVPLRRNVPQTGPRQVVYAGMATMRDGSGIEQRLAAIEEQIGEFGQQRYYRGVADGASLGQAGGVVPITRNGNGQRSTS